MARADYHTANEDPVVYYSDIPMNFERNPITGLLAEVTNEDAVKMSIRNIILTDLGERPHKMFLGSKVRASLFGPSDNVTADLIKTTITSAIKAFEPRAELVEVLVRASPDPKIMIATIVFRTINTTDLQKLEITLKRIR